MNPDMVNPNIDLHGLSANRRSTAPDNKEHSRADVYITTHVPRNGKPLNEKVGGYIQALEAKKSAEEKVQRVQQEIGELREGHAYIISLLQKNNLDIIVDDAEASPLRDDIDLNHNFNEDESNMVQQEHNLGVGPLLPTLQSSRETLETEANN
ncbi:hypothetical protein LINPERPRIM_LOCUS20523, partial [Linum perenne]